MLYHKKHDGPRYKCDGVIFVLFLCLFPRVLRWAVDVVARQAIAALEQAVDTLIVVNNDQLLKIIPSDTPVEHAFKVADDVLRQVGGVFADDDQSVGLPVGQYVGWVVGQSVSRSCNLLVCRSVGRSLPSP